MKRRPYLRNKFSLAGALALVFALVLALPRLEAVNVPIEEAMTMVGGHVTVNDDDANANEEWDKDDTGSLPNTNPKLREFIINIKQTGRPGELTIYDSGLTIGGVVHAKLWKDPNKTAPFELKWPVNGNVVESFPLWVEGIQSTEKIDSLELKAIYEPYELDGKAEASVEFGVFQADLDIDSNNDDGLSASGYDDAEDKIENSPKPNKRGKVIYERNGDVDHDGIPDFADGCDLYQFWHYLLPPKSKMVPGLELFPVRVELKKPIDPAQAKVEFTYNASIPRVAANGIGKDGNGGYEILKRGLRLWRVDGDQRTSGEDVDSGGDFIPSNRKIAWKDVTGNNTVREATLYLEYVDVEKVTDLSSKESISIHVTEKDAPDDVIDEIKVTLQRLKVDLDVDADYDGTISIDKPDDDREFTRGGMVAVGGKREPIVIQRVLPNSTTWDNYSVTLSRVQNGSKIKVFDQAVNGKEITFNGTDNKFLFKSLPKTLYVQGEMPSDKGRDVALALTYDSRKGLVHYEDQIKLTVFKVDVTNIAFNYKPSTATDDGLAIREDRTTPISVPEYVKAAPPAVAGRSFSAAYVKDKSVKILVRMQVQPKKTITDGKLKIKGVSDDTNGALGDAALKTVEFDDNGISKEGGDVPGTAGINESEYVEFSITGNTPDKVFQSIEKWNWIVTEIGGVPISERKVDTSSGHKVYVLWDEPKAPWNQTVSDAKNPWVKALDFAIKTADAHDNNDTAALAAITSYLHTGHGLKYDTKEGMNSFAESGKGETMNLTGYIDKKVLNAGGVLVAHNVVNCYDQAAAVCAFGRLLGLDVEYRFKEPFGYIHPVHLVGVPGPCNNPFYKEPIYPLTQMTGVDDLSRSAFINHAYARYPVGSLGRIYDACAGPQVGTMDEDWYLYSGTMGAGEGVIDLTTPDEKYWADKGTLSTDPLDWEAHVHETYSVTDLK